MVVACFGSGSGQPGEPMYDAMREVGSLLARRGHAVATGAFGGIGMQAAPEGAGASGGRCIGYTYGGTAPNAYITETVDCRELTQQMPFPADYCVRLAGLLSSDAFIAAAGGGIGTFLEFIAVLNFNTKFWSKRIAILSPPPHDGVWNQAMLDQLQAWGLLDDRPRQLTRVVTTAQDAVEWALAPAR